MAFFMKENYRKLKILLKYMLLKKLFDKTKTNILSNGEVIQTILILGLIKMI